MAEFSRKWTRCALIAPFFSTGDHLLTHARTYFAELFFRFRSQQAGSGEEEPGGISTSALAFSYLVTSGSQQRSEYMSIFFYLKIDS